MCNPHKIIIVLFIYACVNEASFLVHYTNEPLMPIFSFLTFYFYSQLLFNWKKNELLLRGL